MFAWPRSYPDNTHGLIMRTPGAGPPDRGYGYRRISSTFHKDMLTSREVPCRQAEAAGRSTPKWWLTGRLSPGAPAPQEDDPGRGEAQLDPLGTPPALLPARVVPDFGVEPDAWACGFEYPFVERVVLRVVQRRAAGAPVDGVARAERLHRRRARSQGAGDPLVAPVFVYPPANVVYELPERNPLIYSHARHRLLFNCSSLVAYIHRELFSSNPQPLV